ncbi:hypothetical protein RHMOL_Rhmol10G0214400 [Rhododendron molle]|nr:hypothetical protein RHMOL_Rhmol10G0214400 [Rhododendron molle]
MRSEPSDARSDDSKVCSTVLHTAPYPNSSILVEYSRILQKFSIFFLISSLYSFNSQLQTRRKDFYWNPHLNSQLDITLVHIYNYTNI